MPQPDSDEVLVAKFAVLLLQLDERQRRLLLGAEAIALGRGGITAVAAAAGVSRPTVTRGVAEAKQGAVSAAVEGRVRRPGGGRKPLTETDPGILADQRRPDGRNRTATQAQHIPWRVELHHQASPTPTVNLNGLVEGLVAYFRSLRTASRRGVVPVGQ